MYLYKTSLPPESIYFLYDLYFPYRDDKKMMIKNYYPGQRHCIHNNKTSSAGWVSDYLYQK